MAACTRTVNLQTCSTAVVSSSSARASSGVRLAKPASRVVFSRRSRAVCSATAEPEAAKVRDALGSRPSCLPRRRLTPIAEP
eukprot:scaffold4196_cov350-Prasinococcus_capsulatus_cf.AAC.2